MTWTRTQAQRSAVGASYSAYGLHIISELELPELPGDPTRTEADLRIRVGPVARPAPQGAEESVLGSAAEAWIAIPSVGTLHIADGRTITVCPEEGVEERVLRLFILGGGLGLALHQRGMLTLHASAVTIAGGAALFLGNSGEGKSTMAGALHAQGYRLLADDVAAVVAGAAGEPLVLPGYPQLKLWPDAARAISGADAPLEPLHPELAKGRLPAGAGFMQRPAPVRAIYMLEDGDHAQLEPLPLPEAFGAISPFAYAAALLGGSAMTPRHLGLMTALAEAVPAFALARPRRLEELPNVAALVAAHCAQLGERVCGS
jgi:hypothetical protein